MIEDMKDEDILDKARMEGMNQGIRHNEYQRYTGT